MWYLQRKYENIYYKTTDRKIRVLTRPRRQLQESRSKNKSFNKIQMRTAGHQRETYKSDKTQMRRFVIDHKTLLSHNY